MAPIVRVSPCPGQPSGSLSTAGGIEADVDFAEADPEVNDEIDAAYHAKYDRWGSAPVGHVTGRDAHGVTISLVRQEEAA